MTVYTNVKVRQCRTSVNLILDPHTCNLSNGRPQRFQSAEGKGEEEEREEAGPPMDG
jgi:hypothetical protein